MRTIALISALAISGCADSPPRVTTYRNLGWARVSAQQAVEECRFIVNATPAQPGLHPLAQGVQSDANFEQCVRAKGWERQ